MMKFKISTDLLPNKCMIYYWKQIYQFVIGFHVAAVLCTS